MKNILAILALTLSSFSTYAANTQVVLCYDCSAHAMQSKAIATAPSGGKVHVVDFNNEIVKAYNIHRELNVATAFPANTNPTINDALHALKSAVESIKKLTSGGVSYTNVQPYMNVYKNSDSAHIVALRPNVKLELAKALSRYFHPSVADTISSAVNSVGISFVTQIMPINGTFNVVFSNGSSYSYQFKTLEFNNNSQFVGLAFAAMDYSGLDDGVSLPDTVVNSFEGYQAHGSPDAISRILDSAITHGVSVIYNGFKGGTCSSCSTNAVDCKEVDRELVCTASEK